MKEFKAESDDFNKKWKEAQEKDGAKQIFINFDNQPEIKSSIDDAGTYVI